MHKGELIAAADPSKTMLSEREHTLVTVDAVTQHLRIVEARSTVQGRYTCIVNDVVSRQFDVVVTARDLLTAGLTLLFNYGIFLIPVSSYIRASGSVRRFYVGNYRMLCCVLCDRRSYVAISMAKLKQMR